MFQKAQFMGFFVCENSRFRNKTSVVDYIQATDRLQSMPQFLCLIEANRAR